jgi:hypothetical protein
MERRESTRLPCRAPVLICVDPSDQDQSFVLDSADIGPEGIFLRTELLFPVGEWLELELRVPGRAQPVRGRGRVIRVNGSRKAPGPGVAVRLPGLSQEERSALARMSIATVRRAGTSGADPLGC